jgi:metal-responsive CopG/Arc/MetJ family transcriptional regulator
MRTTEQISINLPKTWVAKLRELAHQESLKSRDEVRYTDLIRKAIKNSHPYLAKPKTLQKPV